MAAETPVWAVFAELSKWKAGGFVVMEHGQPRHYLSGQALAKVAEKVGAGWDSVSQIPLARLTGLLVAAEAFVPVNPEPVDAATEPGRLQDRADTVFVVHEHGIPTGWFLNHESLFGTIHTPPPIFVCGNGHNNSDPDNGTCAHCPAPLRLKTA